MPNRTKSVLLTLLVAAVAASGVRAEDDLRTYLGADVGAYVHVPNLESSVRGVWKGRLAERVRRLSVYRRWLASEDHRKLQEGQKALSKALGRPVVDFAADLLGTEVLLAVRPRPVGEPEAIVLTRAASEKALGNAITTWNRLDPLQITKKVEHAGGAYFRRETEEQVVFYAFSGSLLALSEQESLVQAFVERVGDDEKPGLVATAAHRRAVASLPDDAQAVVYVATEAWTKVLPANESEPVARLVDSAWRRSESVVATLRAGDESVLDVSIRYAPESVGTTDADRPGHSRFLDRVPSRSLFVAWGRLDLAGLGNGTYEALSEKERKRIEPWRRFAAKRLLGGLDVLDDVLPALGPECGVYLVPRESVEPGRLPFDGLVAVQLRPAAEGETGETTTRTQRELDDLIVASLDFWIASHNASTDGSTATLRSRDDDDVRTRWIDGVGSHQPTYAATPEFLLFASHPSLVPEFVEPRSPERLLDQSWFTSLRDAHFPSPDHLVLWNLAGLLDFVESNREPLTDEVARARKTDRERVEAGMQRLEEFLGVFETAFVAGQVEKDHVRIVVGGAARPRD